ncbi:hemoglobin-like flavoprotein [Thermosporothrix hazakensis]|jgi:hemoglobin-like flavoprotein|uniref:Hemoglobin-like flavoprotein n=2 Tax=Thermosporothrix TaxID=768650 RepID=A0A326U7N9_THEHA|nr:globin domain-containing protein [Thermosporothrix hazakensis]PZW29195.1 hemoglobin-like flavoprotein [Thermosporothrix hazakensis]BBH86122.1 hypothetical protein KTC_08730 [Thermosporothrix sp. COM3]GCE45453.1 hypothetical protein KTH_03220 [Thermosporothrix hazakensis]
MPSLQKSFLRISRQQNEFADTFSRDLLSQYPQLTPFFTGVDMEKHKRDLIAFLGELASSFDQGVQPEKRFHDLGLLHAELQIPPRDYPAFGSTLLATLAQFDPQWSEELKEAWASAIQECVRLMISRYPSGSLPQAGRVFIGQGMLARKKVGRNPGTSDF